MSGFLKEFKEFAMRGNVLDLAVGIIIGAAVGCLVNTHRHDLILPPHRHPVGRCDLCTPPTAGPD